MSNRRPAQLQHEQVQAEYNPNKVSSLAANVASIIASRRLPCTARERGSLYVDECRRAEAIVRMRCVSFSKRRFCTPVTCTTHNDIVHLQPCYATSHYVCWWLLCSTSDNNIMSDNHAVILPFPLPTVFSPSCTFGLVLLLFIIIIIIDIHTRQGAIHEKEEREKEDSREAGSVDQWPAGLCPVANRGLKGSWTDHWPTHVQHRNRKCDIYN